MKRQFTADYLMMNSWKEKGNLSFKSEISIWKRDFPNIPQNIIKKEEENCKWNKKHTTNRSRKQKQKKCNKAAQNNCHKSDKYYKTFLIIKLTSSHRKKSMATPLSPNTSLNHCGHCVDIHDWCAQFADNYNTVSTGLNRNLDNHVKCDQICHS